MSESAFPYRFNRSEPGLFVEIYLPKKIRYQGVLYQSLRTGFNVEEVKKHLKQSDQFVTISEFLEDYEELYEIYKSGNSQEIKKRVEDMEETFYGYSLYEVDGVFFNKKRFEKSEAKDKRINQFVAEENVQFIRITFIPDIEKILCGFEIKKRET